MTAQDAVKDLLEQWHGQRIDRRQLMQRAAALGISASALGAFGVRSNPVAAAQGSSDGDLKLMTTNNEQQATWVRNFNPFGSENSGTRWPTMYGIYDAHDDLQHRHRRDDPLAGNRVRLERRQQDTHLHPA